LTTKGHEVVLLIGQQATFRRDSRAHEVQTFTTTADLRDRLVSLSRGSVDAVFHAAAVSDFQFGKIQTRSVDGKLTEVTAGKIPTRSGTLTVELVPTPKIISELRQWFPKAVLVGWKFEVDSDRANVIRLAQEQIAACKTNACIANGPAYGEGFGVVQPRVTEHFATMRELFSALEKMLCPG
jgi:phosphopantothenoylcysteine decarboxylase/phosphopantothenate--cysteine ligase